MKKTIYHLFDLAQGYEQLAHTLNINALTVHRWRKHGIPWKYWPILTNKYKLSVDDLLQINESIKENKK